MLHAPYLLVIQSHPSSLDDILALKEKEEIRYTGLHVVMPHIEGRQIQSLIDFIKKKNFKKVSLRFEALSDEGLKSFLDFLARSYLIQQYFVQIQDDHYTHEERETWISSTSSTVKRHPAAEEGSPTDPYSDSENLDLLTESPSLLWYLCGCFRGIRPEIKASAELHRLR